MISMSQLFCLEKKQKTLSQTDIKTELVALDNTHTTITSSDDQKSHRVCVGKFDLVILQPEKCSERTGNRIEEYEGQFWDRQFPQLYKL